jgi:hypothetical protein
MLSFRSNTPFVFAHYEQKQASANKAAEREKHNGNSNS